MARRDRRRKQAGALAASLLVHALLLVVLARVAVPAMYQPPTAPTPEFQLQLVNAPPAPSPTPTPRASHRTVARAAPTPAAASRTPAPAPSPAPPARAIQARPTPPPPNAPPAPPSSPSHATASIPASGAANGAATGAGANRWKVTGEDDGQDGVRKFLRATVGCSHEDYVKLSPVERANCDRRVGHDARMMGSASVDTVGPAKRAYYDAVQDAYQSLHDPRPRYDANGNRVMPGRAPGLGCKFGGGDAPPHSLKVGPCFVTPPQGVGTEESGLGVAPP